MGTCLKDSSRTDEAILRSRVLGCFRNLKDLHLMQGSFTRREVSVSKS